jgi:hypothetical protein
MQWDGHHVREYSILANRTQISALFPVLQTVICVHDRVSIYTPLSFMLQFEGVEVSLLQLVVEEISLLMFEGA